MPDDAVLATRVSEQQLAGALVRDEECHADVLSFVEPDDFKDLVSRRVYEAVIGLRAERTQVDAGSVFGWINLHYNHDGIKAAQIGELIAEVPTSANAMYHAKIVAAFAARRRLVLDLAALAERTKPPHLAPVHELLEDARMMVAELERRASGTREPTPLSAAVVEALHQIEDRMTNRRKAGIQTGFLDVDDFITGMRPGNLVVLGARPSTGKSAFAGNVLLNAAADGYNSLFLSLEMEEAEIAERSLAWAGEVSMHDTSRGSVKHADLHKLMAASQKLDNRPGRVHILREKRMHIGQVESAVRAAVRRQNVHLAAIDYAQLIEGSNRRDPRFEQLADITRRLKNLAGECKIPILCLAQLNRDTDGRPTLANFRGSDTFAQDADIALLMYRVPGEPKGPDVEVEVIVAKMRNGPTGTATLGYNGQQLRFSNHVGH